MSNLIITRPPEFLDPWFIEIEQVWDEIEGSVNDIETRLTTAETTLSTSVVTTVHKSGDPSITGDITLTAGTNVVLTQTGNNITIASQPLTAANTSFTPAGNISSTDVQAALQELDSEKAASSHTHVASDITDFDEAAQDALDLAFSAGTHDGVSVTYNDGSDSFDFANTDKGSDAVTNHEAFVDPHANYLLVDGSKSLSGNWAVDALVTIDGRDLSIDGGNLDSHLDGSAGRHDASEIDVEGTYANIAGTPTDLESTISAIDSAISGISSDSLTSTTSTTVFIDSDDNSTTESFTVYHNTATANPGDELFQVRENGEVEIFGGPLIGGSSPFEFQSKETDGASAVGFLFDTQNLLSTDGSKIIAVDNNSVAVLDIRNGDSLIATPSNLFNLYDTAGNLSLQYSADEDSLFAGESGTFSISTSDDYTYSAGYSDTFLSLGISSFDVNTNYQQTTLASLGCQSSGSGSSAGLAADDTYISANQPSSGLQNTKMGTVDTELLLRQVDGSNPDSAILQIKESTNTKFGITKNGGLIINRTAVAVSSDSSQETIIGVTNTAAARTITLKSNDCRVGRIIIIKDESGGAGTNNITIDTEGSETIDGVASVDITVDYGCLRLYSNGNHWFSI
jgi:hypothetical protein